MLIRISQLHLFHVILCNPTKPSETANYLICIIKAARVRTVVKYWSNASRLTLIMPVIDVEDDESLVHYFHKNYVPPRGP